MEYEDLWIKLQRDIINCKKCERLVKWRVAASLNPPRRFKNWSYWAKPLPGFGDKDASILIVGLAPAAHGGNRTGRVFTGDRSGNNLMKALYNVGLANHPYSISKNDGLKLRNLYITAVLRCPPPANKPLREEIDNCREFLSREIKLLRNVRVAVALGFIAYTNLLRTYRELGYNIHAEKFRHGAMAKVYQDNKLQYTILASYHPSPHNVNTGRLSIVMLEDIFRKALRLA